MNDQVAQRNDIETSGKRYEQVLISVANPETAEQTVRLACRLTSPSAVLHIMNVTTEAPFHERAALWRESSQLVIDMTRLANQLDRVAKPLAATSSSVPDAVTSAADEVAADLIILGWFGQVTPVAVRKSRVVRRVLDKARCDTIVLKSRNALSDVARLVVPLRKDYNRNRVAVAQTFRQQQSPLPLVLVHVLTSESRLHAQIAQELLDDRAQQLGPDTQTHLVRNDDVVAGILSVTEEHDLLVVGPGREWVFSRFLFGHNADQLANRAPCSVLMYKARERKLTAWFFGLLKTVRQQLSSGHSET